MSTHNIPNFAASKVSAQSKDHVTSGVNALKATPAWSGQSSDTVADILAVIYLCGIPDSELPGKQPNQTKDHLGELAVARPSA